MSPSVTADVMEDAAELLTGGPGSSSKNSRPATRDDASPEGQLRKLRAARGPYDSTAADINGNGIPDELEARVGLNLQTGNLNGTGDEDGDGITNLDEFRQGTNLERPEPRGRAAALTQRLPESPPEPEYPEPSMAGAVPKEELTEG